MHMYCSCTTPSHETVLHLWSPWACTAGPCPKETPQQIPGPGSTPPAVISLAHGQLAPPPSQSYISRRGASRCRCTMTAQSHDKPLEAWPTPSPSTRAITKPLEPGPLPIRVFAKPFKPGQRQAPRSTPSHRTPLTERATQQSGGAWHAPALFCCSPSGDANGVRLP